MSFKQYRFWLLGVTREHFVSCECLGCLVFGRHKIFLFVMYRLDGRQDSVSLAEPPSSVTAQDTAAGTSSPSFGSPVKRSEGQGHTGMSPPKGKPYTSPSQINYANVLQGKKRVADDKCTIEDAMKGNCTTHSTHTYTQQISGTSRIFIFWTQIRGYLVILSKK